MSVVDCILNDALLKAMSVIRSSITVGGLTLISRIFGYIRDAFIAFALGAGALNDAFIIAFRIPNLFRTIFGEGAFSAAFVPIYSALSTKSATNAKKFAQVVQAWLLIALILFSAIMMFFMPELVRIMAPGYIDDPKTFGIAVELGRITFPYIIFMSLLAFYGGMLNSLGKYAAFASAPIVLNIIMIFSVAFINLTETKAHALSFGVLAAGIVELLWILYFAKKNNLLVNLYTMPTLSEDVKNLFKRMGPGIFSSGIAQINVFITTILASYVIGGISYLYYADRIYQLPLALIGTAMGTVLLPTLAKDYEKGNTAIAIKNQNSAIEFCMLFTIPAMLAIIILSNDIIKLLFEHGEFTSEATTETAKALVVFAYGLPAYVLLKVFTSSFFAVGDTKTPMKVSAFSLVVNVVISLAFLSHFKHVAIAIGSVVSSWLMLIILVKISIDSKRFKFLDKNIIKILKFFISGLLMMLSIYGLETLTQEVNILVSMSLEITIGGLLYLAFCYFFGVITKDQIMKFLKLNKGIQD